MLIYSKSYKEVYSHRHTGDSLTILEEKFREHFDHIIPGYGTTPEAAFDQAAEKLPYDSLSDEHYKNNDIVTNQYKTDAGDQFEVLIGYNLKKEQSWRIENFLNFSWNFHLNL